MSEKKQSLVEHLTEFRKGLIRSLIAIGLGMGVSLYFSKDIFRILQKPLLSVLPQSSVFIATGPIEALVTYLQVALLSGLFVSLPFIFYQVWIFVAPALYVNEKKLALSFSFFASLFFSGGALFGYFLIFPVGFKFFVTALEGTGIQFLPQMQDYLSFISRMLLIFGVVFEIPLLIVGLAKTGLIKLHMLNKAQRYVLVLIFLVAGILTPGPDVLSQFLLAIPLLILYEVSVLAVWLMERKK